MILPKNNPAHLENMKDLARPEIKIVLADSSVPAGQYAVQVLENCSKAREFGPSFREEVTRNVVSYEENVRAVLSKVRLDECDAGIVYSSDIANDSLHELLRINIPDQFNIVAEYPIAIVHETRSSQIAKEFLEFVCSGDGGNVLSKFGFMSVNRTIKR